MPYERDKEQEYSGATRNVCNTEELAARDNLKATYMEGDPEEI